MSTTAVETTRVYAPSTGRETTGTLRYVNVKPGWIVEWNFVYNPDGTKTVSGYTLWPPEAKRGS